MPGESICIGKHHHVHCATDQGRADSELAVLMLRQKRVELEVQKGGQAGDMKQQCMTTISCPILPD
eukprot:481642-Pelagomonas_calceolata.AAC.2